MQESVIAATTKSKEPMPIKFWKGPENLEMVVVTPIKTANKIKKEDTPIIEALTPISKPEEKETRTLINPISSKEMKPNAAPVKRAIVMHVLRWSYVPKIDLLTSQEKNKAVEPLAKGIKKAKELKDLANNININQAKLDKGGLHPHSQYNVWSRHLLASSWPRKQRRRKRYGSIHWWFLGAIIAHSKNILVQTLIE